MGARYQFEVNFPPSERWCSDVVGATYTLEEAQKYEREWKSRWASDIDKSGWKCRVSKIAASAGPVILTTDKAARKEMPIARGVVDYFPRALAAIARVSFVANNQHNPGEPMHWDKTKSTDHADCIARHLIERGALDDDGLRHSAKLAWRALALLETELEAE